MIYDIIYKTIYDMIYNMIYDMIYDVIYDKIHDIISYHIISLLVRAECVRCPWLMAQTKVAIVLGIISPYNPNQPGI